MKTINSVAAAQVIASSRKPVVLVQIVASASTTLYYAVAKSNVTFPTAGQVYTAKTILMDPITRSATAQADRIKLRFDNTRYDASGSTEPDMRVNHELYNFRGKAITIYRIFRDAVSNAAYKVELFYGILGVPAFDYNWMTIEAVSGADLRMKLPNRTYTRQCSFTFGDARCGYTFTTYPTAGWNKIVDAAPTSNSTTYDTLIDTKLTQGADYWNFGRITITKTGYAPQVRYVKDFSNTTDTVTLDADLPFLVATADTTYTMQTGCDKKQTTCAGSAAYGPGTTSTDNSNKFGGFPHMGQGENIGRDAIGSSGRGGNRILR